MLDRRILALTLVGLVLPLWAGEAEPQDADHANLVATILARPLFTSGRKPTPPKPPASITAVPAPVPHLMGIVVAGETRLALFAAPDRHQVPVLEGARIGGYLVKVIAPRHVGLAAPSGADMILVPSPDPATRSALVSIAPPTPLVDPFRRERETESNQ